MKIAAIIPVKTFSKAKTRLNLPLEKKIELCKIMLYEILHTLSISSKIDSIIVVTKDKQAMEICKKYNATIIIDEYEKGVNEAVSLADKHVIKKKYDASIVFPQDIPLIKTQDIDFMLKFHSPPNFAIIVPSRKFDGTNALVRMPPDLMETHYDDDSYRNHMKMAKKNTVNATLVFVNRIMADVDTIEDLAYIFEKNEKPELLKKLRNLSTDELNFQVFF